MADINVAAVNLFAVPPGDDSERISAVPDSGVLARPVAADRYSSGESYVLPDNPLPTNVVSSLFGDPLAARRLDNQEREYVREQYAAYLEEIARYRAGGRFENLRNSVLMLRDAADGASNIEVRDREALRFVQFAQYAFYRKSYELSDEALAQLIAPGNQGLSDEHFLEVSEAQAHSAVQLKHLAAVVSAANDTYRDAEPQSSEVSVSHEYPDEFDLTEIPANTGEEAFAANAAVESGVLLVSNAVGFAR
ncbi:MAG: hypothetical protein WC956_07965 [bacterium]